MNKPVSLLNLAVALGACVFASGAQGIGSAGMNAPLNQIEAVESHLQQSRIQAKHEAGESANIKPKASESAKPTGTIPAAKQKKPDGDTEKTKSMSSTVVK